MEKDTRLEALGKRIRTVRQAKQLSQDELARLCGYNSRSSINKIEAGLNDIPQSKIKAIADALSVSPAWLMGYDDADEPKPKRRKKYVKIPVLGSIVAGTPREAIEDILDYEEIPESLARTGDFFGLQVTGASMEPTLREGDVIICKSAQTCDTGDIAVVMINGDEATVKEIKRGMDGVTLIGHNVAVFPPKFYSNREIEELPVRVIGVAYEVRRKFKAYKEE